MKVIDSSVLVPALSDDGSQGDQARASMRNDQLAAPGLIDVEVVSALRRLVRTEVVGVDRAQNAIDDLPFSPVIRAPHVRLVARVWELRDNLSAYDASYVALAEAMNCPLLTADRKLASAPGIRCEVELLA